MNSDRYWLASHRIVSASAPSCPPDLPFEALCELIQLCSPPPRYLSLLVPFLRFVVARACVFHCALFLLCCLCCPGFVWFPSCVTLVCRSLSLFCCSWFSSLCRCASWPFGWFWAATVIRECFARLIRRSCGMNGIQRLWIPGLTLTLSGVFKQMIENHRSSMTSK